MANTSTFFILIFLSLVLFRLSAFRFVPFRFVSSHVHKFLVVQPRRCFPSLTSPCLSRLNFFFYLIWERKLDAANAAVAAAASMVFFFLGSFWL